MPRVKLFDKQEALQKAMELFWEKGYESTSLFDLTEVLGIGKGSFYATFHSKKDLFDHCFERYQSQNVPFIKQALYSESDIKEGVKKLLYFYADQLLSDVKHRGCFIANSCSEISHTEVDIQDKLKQHYDAIQVTIRSYLVDGGMEETKALSCASTIVTCMIGMSQQSKFNFDKTFYEAIISNMLQLIG